MQQECRGVIGVLSTEVIWPEFFDSYVGLEKPHGTVLVHRKRELTPTARNNVVKYALKQPNCEWVFFMDSDQTFHSWALKKLLPRLSKWDVIGAAYFLRISPFHAVAYRHVHGIDYETMTTEIMSYLHSKNAPLGGNIARYHGDDGVMPCDGLGTGAMLISRRILEKIEPPYFSYEEGGSEDLYFCRKVKAAHGKIAVDAGLTCGHMIQLPVGYTHTMAALSEDR